MPLGSAVRREFESGRLISSVTAGAVVSVTVVIVSVSLGTLIFGGRLEPFLSQGLALMLFSGVVITLVTSLTSSYPGMVATPQERVAPILAVMAAAIVSQLGGAVSDEVVFLTVVCAILCASLANGVFLTLLGMFRLGALIRFIPYPVIGGFLAGTGWLLVVGSVGVMTGLHVDTQHLHELIEGQRPGQWSAGIAFGMALVYGTHRFHKSWILPAILIGGISLFYLVLAMRGISAADARAAGWLLGPFPESEPWKPLTVQAITQAQWSVIWSQAGHFGSILLITVISVLLNSGAMELIAKRDIDLNRELKVAGGANLLLGAGGGTVGFHSLSVTRLGFQIGSDSRLIGIIASGTCAVMLFAGSDVLSFLPRCILGGLLFFLGAHFLIDWVYESWFRLTKSDYFVVIAILGVVASFGYLMGVVVGIIACVVLFLINYASVNVVKHALSGSHQHSNVDRPTRHFRFLQEHGDKLQIFKLQGYIFFGTANGLLEDVRRRLNQADKERLEYMLLDFSAVTGIDSSSVLSFIKMAQLAEQREFTLVFSSYSSSIERLLRKENFHKLDADVFRSFASLDYALEWCENAVLEKNALPVAEYDSVTLKEQLGEEVAERINLDTLLGYFERLELDSGSVLIEEGAAADDLFLIESGQVTAKLEFDGGEHRLRTMRAGAVVGELGMILEEPRTATVVADRATVAYRLTRHALRAMEAEQPAVAMAFHHFLTRLISERLANTNQTVKLLLD